MTDRDRLQQLLNLQRPERESVEVVSQIRELIERDLDALDLYIEWCHFESNLQWLADGSEIAESVVVSQIRAERKLNLRIRIWSSVACVSVLSVLTVLAWGWSVHREHRHEPVAPLAGYVEFTEPETTLRGVSPRTLIRQGSEIECDAGAFHLRMDSGALLAGSGPAKLVVHNSQLVEVIQGTVVADVPPRGFGFSLLTPGGKIVDLGTKFGVRVLEDRSSEVHVFQGRVQAAKNSSSGIEVTAGSARSIKATGEIGPKASADPILFNRELIRLAGVRSVSANLKYLESPPASFIDPELSQPGIFLVLERRNVSLPRSSDLFDALPGVYLHDALPAPADLPPGDVFDSYLIHGNHHGTSNVNRAELTFEHPIVAVALSAKQLHETDQACGHPGIRYPRELGGQEPFENRGFVHSPEALAEAGDILEILPDQRTLRLTMSCGFQRIDEIRIFVARPVN